MNKQDRRKAKTKEPIEITVKVGALEHRFTGDVAERIYAAIQSANEVMKKRNRCKAKTRVPIEITVVGALWSRFTDDAAERIYAVIEPTIFDELNKAGAFKECGDG